MKLVSFSLYGTAPRYIDGALANAKLMKVIYPDWVMRVYCDDFVDTEQLEKYNCQIIRMGISHIHSGRLWRFLPAWEEGIERSIFRDVDSRINVREAAAVQAWIDSGLDAHCMYDHPHHTCLTMLGGTWGIKSGILPNLMAEWTGYMSGLNHGITDTIIMTNDIWPYVKNSILRHSSVEKEDALPFPEHASWNGFIGQQHNDLGEQVWP